MAGSGDDFEKELKENLKRAATAIARGVADELERGFSKARESQERARERERERERTREERREARRREERERRDRRRREQLERTSPFEGAFYLLVAFVLVALAAVSVAEAGQLWWLVFPAIGFGSKGAKVLSYHREERRKMKALATANEPPPLAPAPDAVERDPRQARVEAVCDRLVVALRESPEGVRAFLNKPEETVDALRVTSRDLLKRERALRRLVSADEVARLTRERETLAARVEAERDDIAKSRFAAALALLDQQRAHHAELARNADRLEAEHLRLAYTLEGLEAQVMRMRSADASSADVAGAGLRQSLDALRDEVGAMADALEHVNRSEREVARESVNLPGAVPPEDVTSARPRGRGRERE